MPPKRKAEQSDPAYGRKDYWDKRYIEGDGIEWYFDYTTLKPLLHILFPKPFTRDSSCLEIGCGDRPLLAALMTDPHFLEGTATGCDFAPSVVRSLRKEEREKRELPRIKYEEQDARDMTYVSNSIDLVLDKGTIDAMICDPECGEDNAWRIVSEMSRVVRPGGCFVIISHMAPSGDEGDAFIRSALFPALLSQPPTALWGVDVHFAESAAETGPFVYVVQKTNRRSTRGSEKGARQMQIPLRLVSY